MGQKSKIEWTDASWSPIRAKVKEDAAEIANAKGYTSLAQIATRMAGHVGPHCEKVSPGCDHCYSEANNSRCLSSNGTGLPFDGRARGLVDVILDEKILAQPLHWKKPRRVFVCSQTDLFAEFVPHQMIDRMFAVMALCPQHTFQVLTKQAQRMEIYFAEDVGGWQPYRQAWDRIGNIVYFDQQWAWLQSSYRQAWDRIGNIVVSREFQKISDWNVRARPRYEFHDKWWPLPNVWLGVSVENQKYADKRIPHLLQTAAAVRFLSVEPLLGPVDLTGLAVGMGGALLNCLHRLHPLPGIDWVIVGGESGREARPMHPDWVRSIRDQCVAAGIPFFFKQWGQWAPFATEAHYAAGSLLPGNTERVGGCCGGPGSIDFLRTKKGQHPKVRWADGREMRAEVLNRRDHKWGKENLQEMTYLGVGKKKAGRILDGRPWDQMPDYKERLKHANS